MLPAPITVYLRTKQNKLDDIPDHLHVRRHRYCRGHRGATRVLDRRHTAHLLISPTHSNCNNVTEQVGEVT